MFIAGQQPVIYPGGARGPMPYPQAMPGAQGGRGAGFPAAVPIQQGGRGGPTAQGMPPMYMPPGMAPGFAPPYMPQYLQLAQAAQQAAIGRGAGGRGQMAPIPGMPPQMGAVSAIRGGQSFPQGAGRGTMPGRPGQVPNFAQQPRGPAMPQGAGPAGVDLSSLNQAPPHTQKQVLGEALYPKIHEMQPELAGKITGMLLEMENSELINL